MSLANLSKRIGRLPIPMMLFVMLIQFTLIETAEAARWRATPHVFPPDASPYGRTYGEWTAIYVQALFGIVWDPASCNFGSFDRVMLLQSTAGGAGEFECEAPVGTAFLMPVITAFFLCPHECGPGTPVPNGTVEELRAAADAAADLVAVVECEVDGRPVQNPLSFRFQSPVFAGEIVAGSLFNVLVPEIYVPGPFGPAVVDGYWVMVSPLPVGEHVIHFRGVAEDPPGNPVFETESTHHITVVPDGGRALSVEPSTWGSIKAAYR
jgi:hypothetical protein